MQVQQLHVDGCAPPFQQCPRCPTTTGLSRQLYEVTRSSNAAWAHLIGLAVVHALPLSPRLLLVPGLGEAEGMVTGQPRPRSDQARLR